MANRKPYHQRSTGLSGWILKAIGLAIAGATMMIVALTIAKTISFKSGSAPAGKFTGIRHQAAPMPPEAAHNPTDVAAPTSDPGQDGSAATVVRNGITIVSPQLRVPIIDIAALQAASGSEVFSSSQKASGAGKRSRYVKRSHSHRKIRIAAKRWMAYGLANR